MVLLSPSISALRKLLAVCETYAETHGLQYNPKKSQVLMFKAGSYTPSSVPPVVLHGTTLSVVDKVKYLGHIITQDLNDDLDIERERRALAVRSNMLARRFARCSREVKIVLFKAFNQSFYSSSLWVKYTKKALNALRVQYNNALRMLLGLPTWCSASRMFAEAQTDDFHAVMRKRIVSMMGRLRSSTNSILDVIAERPENPILAHWIRQVIGFLKFRK
ncbi:uncharacterized protein LOC134666122 [Cydia fagiglandana]|uniref:uncharacterized protein LOC134666122 n=1 Tax=Cydia fagiglandana TaxID=1458189 RepID=UPI002FEE324A